MKLIDADALYDIVIDSIKPMTTNEAIILQDFVALLEDAPTVDAEPVKHGHWNEAKDGTLWCSVCISTGPYDEDSWGYVLNAPHYDYCPNCGAKMDEVEE